MKKSFKNNYKQMTQFTCLIYSRQRVTEKFKDQVKSNKKV